MIALTNHQENKLVGRHLRDIGYDGHITAIVRYKDQGEELEEYGIESFDLYNEAGRGFAEHAEASRRRRAASAASGRRESCP